MEEESIIGTVVKLKNGSKGKVMGQIVRTGEYLLAESYGGQINQGFFIDDIEEFNIIKKATKKLKGEK